MKTLGQLVAVLLHKRVAGPLDIPVTGITYHSGRVRPGNIFACLEGRHGTGESYAAQAVLNGAGAVLTELETVFPGVTTVCVPDVRLALALLSSHFYDYPSAELVLTGVTGTNGKTTTTHLIDALMKSAGKPTGLIGTVSYRILEHEFPVLATTPEACELQSLFSQMCESGVTHAIMEVSSHALALKRTVGCDFDTVVLTNITEDHLDFHNTFEHYLGSKAKLFAWLGSLPHKRGRRRRAVINGDDQHYSQIVEMVAGETLLYGLSPHCQVRASDVRVAREGVSFILSSPWCSLPVKLRMTGLFSVYNALAAACCGLLEGLSPEAVRDVLEEVPGITGRFELVDEGQDFTVIVDYAHTPDGLENVLRAVRGFARRRVITVFGCGGERDRSKRPLMGKVAAAYSDICLVTSDNPRGEDPEQIFAEILPGLAEAAAFEIIPDRAMAVFRALQLATEGDVVLIAGKGHETQQIFKDYAIPFDDRVVAREGIRRLKGYGNEVQGGPGSGQG